ncbi:hypothetical protein FB192DRAFT_1391075 [Mucor lusitanicus]|uniref:Uncharacterized protein n=1 Tax=Mucor circinelloides f. lusitanicus TaxID=29924 RepID=A0A8H4EZF9_MUCCL|nr:hypothetical protein FB192DRAFT_1391075 [Mucor lusitanicus]
MFRWTVLNLLYELDAGDFLKIACGTLELSNDIDCTLKAGESINTASTTNKKEIYSDSTHVKAFKIGFRFLADMAQDEYDIGVGECAIHPSELKAVKANLQGKQKTLLIKYWELYHKLLIQKSGQYRRLDPPPTLAWSTWLILDCTWLISNIPLSSLVQLPSSLRRLTLF